MTLSGLEYGFFFEKEAYLGMATGTFVNRNHLAGYLEICLAVGIGLMVAQLSDTPATNWRDRARSFLQTMLSTKALIRLGLVVMVIGLVLTRSRMGNTAFFVSMLVAGFFYIVFVRRLTRGTVIFFASLLLIDLLVVGNFFGIEKVAERMQQAAVDGDMRSDLSRDTLAIVGDYPLTGTGAGSFFSVFPMYNTGELEFGFAKHAHNDYLEFVTDLGLFALVLLAFSVLLSLWQGIRAQLERRDRLMQGMGFAATMAIIALLIHSISDFNLHIPANASTFVVILALGWVSRNVSAEV
jgi:O-antigen ligase